MGINRNIVECKGWILNYFNIRVICINRNIVECKAFLVRAAYHGAATCINRNIVECKVIS